MSLTPSILLMLASGDHGWIRPDDTIATDFPSVLDHRPPSLTDGHIDDVVGPSRGVSVSYKDSTDRANASMVNRRSYSSLPASAKPLPSSGLSASARIAAAISSWSPGATNNAVRRSSSTSGIDPTGVQMTGVREASASSIT